MLIECSICGAGIINEDQHREYHKERGDEIPDKVTVWSHLFNRVVVERDEYD